jgi:hypothetical protein
MKNFFFGLLFFLLAGSVCGQKFSATVSKNPVAAGEAFQITFSIDGSESGFQVPDLSDFNVLSGPNATQSMQIIMAPCRNLFSTRIPLAQKKKGSLPSARLP